jgi:hypothetical protein
MGFDFEHCGCMQHYACFDCRKTFKKPGSTFVRGGSGGYVPRLVPCPDCGRPMKPMGLLFRAPPRRAVKAWKRLWERVRGTALPPFQLPRRRQGKG